MSVAFVRNRAVVTNDKSVFRSVVSDVASLDGEVCTRSANLLNVNKDANRIVLRLLLIVIRFVQSIIFDGIYHTLKPVGSYANSKLFHVFGSKSKTPDQMIDFVYM